MEVRDAGLCRGVENGAFGPTPGQQGLQARTSPWHPTVDPHYSVGALLEVNEVADVDSRKVEAYDVYEAANSAGVPAVW